MLTRRLFFVFFVVTGLALSVAHAQPLYRTFNQVDLSGKKAKAGKALGSTGCFIFRNDSTGLTVNSLHARFNATVTAILDSGGFTAFTFDSKRKIFDATGRTVSAGDSVHLCFAFDKKSLGVKSNFWWWDTNGVTAGTKRGELRGDITLITIQPNGGNVLEYLYKHVIERPAGLIVGTRRADSSGTYGWIRYKTADRKFFPHGDSSRCFDYIISGNGNRHPFLGELKNPHVKKHDNHLLGELHALKLAVIANDSGVTQPDTPATRLGDLIYNDLSNSGDPANNRTIRQVIAFVDSALTYCTHFVAADYFPLDSAVSRINRAFDGPYVAVSLKPFVLAGTNPLPAFLHPNPAAAPVAQHRVDVSVADETPQQAQLFQNYPNPFNPTTTIEFSLPVRSVVTLDVYNILGQKVATLLDRQDMDEGAQSVDFDASRLSSGVYFYRITAMSTDANVPSYHAVKRMVVMK